MILCIGSCSGLPEFGQITQIVAANPDILFVFKKNDGMVPRAPSVLWTVLHSWHFYVCS